MEVKRNAVALAHASRYIQARVRRRGVGHVFGYWLGGGLSISKKNIHGIAYPEEFELNAAPSKEF